MSETIDIGHGHTLRLFGWAPDRDLNPQFAGIPDEPRAGATIDHPHAETGEPCSGAITFDTAVTRQLRAAGALWQIEVWEPLTISPSILCSCGDHGFIRAGRWEPA